jgi:glycopeptide antibiotics resistance protein
VRRFIPFFIWTLLILGLCSIPGKAIPKISWLELLSFDKFVHASIFFVEQILFMRALHGRTRHYKWMALLFCVSYGGGLELMQTYSFSERSGDVLDFIANATGAFVGLLLYERINKKLGFLPA